MTVLLVCCLIEIGLEVVEEDEDEGMDGEKSVDDDLRRRRAFAFCERVFMPESMVLIILALISLHESSSSSSTFFRFRFENDEDVSEEDEFEDEDEDGRRLEEEVFVFEIRLAVFEFESSFRSGVIMFEIS